MVERQKCYDREMGMCAGCGILLMNNDLSWDAHHVNFNKNAVVIDGRLRVFTKRRDDSDQAWNLEPLCNGFTPGGQDCHGSIHQRGNERLREQLRNRSVARKPLHLRSAEIHPKYAEQKLCRQKTRAYHKTKRNHAPCPCGNDSCEFKPTPKGKQSKSCLARQLENA